MNLFETIKDNLNESSNLDKQQVLNDFAEEIDLTPLYDKLRQMSGISGLEFTSKVDVSPAHIEIQSVSVLDACGVFKLGLQNCVFETFNSRINFLEDSDVPYWWGTIDLRYSNKRGGTNGIEVLRFSYNEEPGKWIFNEVS